MDGRDPNPFEPPKVAPLVTPTQREPWSLVKRIILFALMVLLVPVAAAIGYVCCCFALLVTPLGIDESIFQYSLLGAVAGVGIVVWIWLLTRREL